MRVWRMTIGQWEISGRRMINTILIEPSYRLNLGSLCGLPSSELHRCCSSLYLNLTTAEELSGPPRTCSCRRGLENCDVDVCCVHYKNHA